MLMLVLPIHHYCYLSSAGGGDDFLLLQLEMGDVRTLMKTGMVTETVTVKVTVTMTMILWWLDTISIDNC